MWNIETSIDDDQGVLHESKKNIIFVVLPTTRLNFREWHVEDRAIYPARKEQTLKEARFEVTQISHHRTTIGGVSFNVSFS